ncbi:thiamine phosphate synthase [Larsenimonas salina]|uniref:thiamine phosphate synthase n=1 Tax=Larsenimonas salina TaxID=1295565 RepID=UPI0020735E7A|nr:thiamine phosphate synthase [Larsenimonas salina]MCM5704693.1 thiamine phosphate synthase [Larsenimonas salina]
MTESLSWQRGLYVLTDETLLPDDERLFNAVDEVLAAGIALLQYRNKRGSADERLRQAQGLYARAQAAGTPLIINDDVELAYTVGAGVHLGQGDGSIRDARLRLGPDAIIGATCHDSLEFARAALDEGADYVAFGRFFDSHTKPDTPPAALSVLTEARTLGCPVVAIGGIDHRTTPQVREAGADLIAVVGAVFGGGGPADNVERLRRVLGC